MRPGTHHRAMRQAAIYYRDRLAGTLTQNDEGYIFVYDNEYIRREGSLPVSLTLPLSQKEFRSTVLFSFFDGLIPEGWLLDVARHNWKIDARDRMGLLLVCCKDCIGSVSVVPLNNDNDEQ